MPVTCPICKTTLLSKYAWTEYPNRVCHVCLDKHCRDVDFDQIGKSMMVNGQTCRVSTARYGGKVVQVVKRQT